MNYLPKGRRNKINGTVWSRWLKLRCCLSFDMLRWVLLFIYKSDLWEEGDRVDCIITKPGGVKLPQTIPACLEQVPRHYLEWVARQIHLKQPRVRSCQASLLLLCCESPRISRLSSQPSGSFWPTLAHQAFSEVVRRSDTFVPTHGA